MTSAQTKRDPDVSLVVEYVERTGGPMHETHHWHANASVAGENVCDCWCYTRAIALDEAVSSLAAAGVDLEEALA